jgi:lipoprotein-anchoring transpeptidase ErfK/SrfK
MRAIFSALPLVLLAACNSGTGGAQQAPSETPSQPVAETSADPLAAHDPAAGASASAEIADPVARPVMQAQVVLDRLGFTPGVVDGKDGLSTRNAVSGFQEANGLTVTGKLDQPTLAALKGWSNIPATRVVTIPAAGPYSAIPKDPQEQAKLPALGYASLDEALAERFHTTIAVLKELNPGGRPAGIANTESAVAADASAPATSEPRDAGSASQPGAPVPVFRAGQQIRVPNVGGDAIDPAAVSDAQWRATLASLGVGSSQPNAARLVVSKAKGTMKVYDAADKLVAVYTATMGSQHDPLPLGDWKINGTAYNPPFHYNPDLFWDASAKAEKAKLPPGPNGPVGVVWIDLSKPHYGIHGTPNPETIGRAESHGCVRLTNWDAARLAQMVSPKTKVKFEA